MNKRNDIERQLNDALALRASLPSVIQGLQEQLKRMGPAEPMDCRATITVWYDDPAKGYEYLLYRPGSVGTAWYTTGQGADVKVFTRWSKLVEWLNSPGVLCWDHLQELVVGAELR